MLYDLKKKIDIDYIQSDNHSVLNFEYNTIFERAK
jgi:hypothetical protein